MGLIRGIWSAWHRRKFTKCGKHFRLKGRRLTVEGHVELGDHVQLRDNCILRASNAGKIIFGTYCGCSWNCIIEANGLVEIGDYTGIAENVVIRDTNHAVQGTDDHWRLTPHIVAPIRIGKSCLIGSGCYINPGVTINDGAVIAPMSLVTRDVGNYEIWAGVPARRVGHRTKNLPEGVRKRYQELVEKYGVKAGRYGYEEKNVVKPAAEEE
jgi:dTDP-4-amino-4,6-dideoxy-D-glucose acyltransferase